MEKGYYYSHTLVLFSTYDDYLAFNQSLIRARDLRHN